MHFVEFPNRNYSKPLDASTQGKSVLHCSQRENAQATGLHRVLFQPILVLIRRQEQRFLRRNEASVLQAAKGMTRSEFQRSNTIDGACGVSLHAKRKYSGFVFLGQSLLVAKALFEPQAREASVKKGVAFATPRQALVSSQAGIRNTLARAPRTRWGRFPDRISLSCCTCC